MMLLWAAAAVAVSAPAAEWRAQVGGQFDADSHGVADVGVRAGELSAELLTDTLDARFSPESEAGRSWVGLRVAAFAGNLLISPWRDGAPAPELGLSAGYVGPELGALAYLPGGLYAGAAGHVRTWWFGAYGATAEPIPENQGRVQASAIVGWWHADAHVWARGGVDLGPTAQTVVQPHLHLTGTSRPEGWTVAPRAELRGGIGWGQDELSRTLVGGLNPYVVPLAGAAWGELRMERYVAARVGPSLAAGAWQIDAVADLVWGQHRAVVADPRALLTARLSCGTIRPGAWQSCEHREVAEVGFGLLTRWQPHRLFVQADAGWAPWLRRQRGEAVSVYAAVGVDWGEGRPGAASD